MMSYHTIRTGEKGDLNDLDRVEPDQTGKMKKMFHRQKAA